MCAREEMASYPNLRPTEKPSDSSEGIRMSWILLLAVAALVFAAGTVFALSELATPRGDHTVHSTPAFVRHALGAPQRRAPLTRRPAPNLSITIASAGLHLRCRRRRRAHADRHRARGRRDALRQRHARRYRLRHAGDHDRQGQGQGRDSLDRRPPSRTSHLAVATRHAARGSCLRQRLGRLLRPEVEQARVGLDPARPDRRRERARRDAEGCALEARYDERAAVPEPDPRRLEAADSPTRSTRPSTAQMRPPPSRERAAPSPSRFRARSTPRT